MELGPIKNINSVRQSQKQLNKLVQVVLCKVLICIINKLVGFRIIYWLVTSCRPLLATTVHFRKRGIYRGKDN